MDRNPKNQKNSKTDKEIEGNRELEKESESKRATAKTSVFLVHKMYVYIKLNDF